MLGRIGSHDRPPRFWIVLSLNVFALLLSIGVLAWVVTRPLGPGDNPGLVILGEQALKAEAARRGLAEGNVAPGFGGTNGLSLGLTDLEARAIDLAGLSGRPVWIVFWATYCEACQAEEPDLRKAYGAHRDDGLVVLAIDAGESADDVRRYANERRLPWLIALDPKLTAYDAFGAIGTPIHYFVAADGRIASRAFGRLTLPEMEAHLARILPRRD